MESEHGGRWRTAFHDISRRCLRKKGSKLYNIYRHVNAPLGSFVYPRHRLRSPPFPETNVRQIAQSNFLDVFESLKKTLRVWSFSGTKRWRLHQLAKYKKNIAQELTCELINISKKNGSVIHQFLAFFWNKGSTETKTTAVRLSTPLIHLNQDTD